MTLNEKLTTIQTKFKSKKVGLTRSANITFAVPKTFSKLLNPLKRSWVCMLQLVNNYLKQTPFLS